jgi:two-component system response regulator RegA
MKNRTVEHELSQRKARESQNFELHAPSICSVAAGFDSVPPPRATNWGREMHRSAQRLLVVEDDVTVARALSRTFARRGFAVALVRSCGAARALAQEFDFAILDLDLPDGNGVDLARELLTNGRVPTVVFFSGSSDAALLARARRVGTVIVKSAGTSEILALLTQDSASADAPQSRTAPSTKARGFRASSGTVSAAGSTAFSSSLSKSRAR